MYFLSKNWRSRFLIFNYSHAFLSDRSWLLLQVESFRLESGWPPCAPLGGGESWEDEDDTGSKAKFITWRVEIY